MFPEAREALNDILEKYPNFKAYGERLTAANFKYLAIREPKPIWWENILVQTNIENLTFNIEIFQFKETKRKYLKNLYITFYLFFI